MPVSFPGALICLSLVACDRSPGSSEARLFQNGVAFTGDSVTACEGPGPGRSPDNLKAVNDSRISVLVTACQDTIHSTSVDFAGPLTPNDASLEKVIRSARDLGLKVMLKPHVDPAVQSHYDEAELRMLSGQSWVRGLYWWPWSPGPDDGGLGDTGDTPRGKPAEGILRPRHSRLK